MLLSYDVSLHPESESGRDRLQGRSNSRRREENNSWKLRHQQDWEEGLQGHRECRRRLRRDDRRYAEPRQGGFNLREAEGARVEAIPEAELSREAHVCAHVREEVRPTAHASNPG